MIPSEGFIVNAVRSGLWVNTNPRAHPIERWLLKQCLSSTKHAELVLACLLYLAAQHHTLLAPKNVLEAYTPCTTVPM